MRKHSITFDHEQGQTKQSFKDECNINKILAKFQKSGAITHYASHAPNYGDATQIELQDALNVVANADTMFEELPSSIRKKFNNDAGQFLAFVQDPKNREEMEELGLSQKTSPDVQTADAASTPRQNAPASKEKQTAKEPKGDGQETQQTIAK